MKISIITPSYNNLEYLKLCHQSLVDNIKDIEWEHCVSDDGSVDGTREWCIDRSKNESNFYFLPSDKRVGHTVLYNDLVKKSSGDIIFIFHADMFLVSPNTIPNMLKYLKPKTVVSATRVEPIGMYPPSSEKILTSFGGLTINTLNFEMVNNFIKKIEPVERVTKGFFAPWMCYKNDYLDTDLIFAPWPCEDADQGMRFKLADYDLVQPWNVLVPHFCSKGHRKTNENNPTQDNNEYAYFERRARRNYLRKWHSWMRFDEYRMPLPPKVYDVGFVIENLTDIDLLRELEPWCSTVYIDNERLKYEYIDAEQPHTIIPLMERIKHINSEKTNSIILTFDRNRFVKDVQNNFKIIQLLSQMISDSGEIGKMTYGIFDIEIKSLNSHEKELIKINNQI